MLEYLEFFVGTFIGGILLGIFATLLPLNRTYDSEKREAVITLIDDLVHHFHRHYSADNEQSSATARILDYGLKSLIGDTLLIPIIGRSFFDNNYYPLLSKFYLLSLPSPDEMSDEFRETHIKAINEIAVKLKRMVNHKSGSLRLLNRK